jgi:hypothetical protein
MRRALRIAAAVTVAMVAGALAAPAAALAGPVTFRYYPYATAEAIDGFDVAEHGSVYAIGYTDLSRYGTGHLVVICDEWADGRSVFARIDSRDNGVIEYSAPASNARGNTGRIGCNEYVLGYPINKFRLRIAAAASNWRPTP